MSFKTTKFHEILLSDFSGVALTNCFELLCRIFHFDQISKYKKVALLLESEVALKNCFSSKKKIEFPVKMHIYTLCPSLLQIFTKFC